MAKSAQAFRTIGEVSEALDTPAHVLRFWESKFAQVRPVKRAGGRRYYRPEDLDLLGGIKALLHDQGMTIKGVQKLLREKGVRHVADHGRDLCADPVLQPAPVRPNRPDPSQAEDAVLVLDPATDLAQLLQRRSGPTAPSETGARAPLALLHAAGPAFLETRAARIAPLVERLENLRGRMLAARDGKR